VSFVRSFWPVLHQILLSNEYLTTSFNQVCLLWDPSVQFVLRLWDPTVQFVLHQICVSSKSVTRQCQVCSLHVMSMHTWLPL